MHFSLVSAQMKMNWIYKKLNKITFLLIKIKGKLNINNIRTIISMRAIILIECLIIRRNRLQLIL